jgi:uncharacterized damage-inducible protein DinB
LEGQKQLPMLAASRRSDMNEQEALSVLTDQQPEASPPCLASSCKSERDRLRAELLALIADHGDRHHMGSHLSDQSLFNIGAGISDLLERFCIHEPR